MPTSGRVASTLQQRLGGGAQLRQRGQRGGAGGRNRGLRAGESLQLALHVRQQRLHGGTAIAPELAPEQIVRLDAGGALVDRR